MMSNASSETSLLIMDVAYDIAIGGVYGRGVCLIGCAYGAVGRCRLEAVENCELLLVERLCLERLLTGVKVTSETDFDAPWKS